MCQVKCWFDLTLSCQRELWDEKHAYNVSNIPVHKRDLQTQCMIYLGNRL